MNFFNKKKEANPWPFDAPANTAVITTRHITKNNQPILLVVHDGDNEWQFLTSGDFSLADAQVLGLGEVVGIDASLLELADLPMGWFAARQDANAPWKRAKDDVI